MVGHPLEGDKNEEEDDADEGVQDCIVEQGSRIKSDRGDAGEELLVCELTGTLFNKEHDKCRGDHSKDQNEQRSEKNVDDLARKQLENWSCYWGLKKFFTFLSELDLVYRKIPPSISTFSEPVDPPRRARLTMLTSVGRT